MAKRILTNGPIYLNEWYARFYTIASPNIPTLNEFFELAADVDRDEVEKFYNSQEIVQIHKKPPEKSKLQNHYQISANYDRWSTCDASI